MLWMCVMIEFYVEYYVHFDSSGCLMLLWILFGNDSHWKTEELKERILAFDVTYSLL
jgi:hypothetical protein